MKPFTQGLLFEFDGLTPESICVDAGSHEGNWGHEMWSRYKCKIVAFEPLPEYIAKTHERLKGTGAIIMPMALWGGGCSLDAFGVHGAMSGAYSDGGKQLVTKVGIQDLFGILHLVKVDVDKIGVLKLNVEASEFGILERILENSIATRFENIIVQPHNIIPDAESRWKRIDDWLQETHDLVWHADWCWSGYKLRK